MLIEIPLSLLSAKASILISNLFVKIRQNFAIETGPVLIRERAGPADLATRLS